MLKTPEERIRLLIAGFSCKAIEKMYIEQNGFKITNLPLYIELVEFEITNFKKPATSEMAVECT
ncbi:MAG: hypothetical protein FIB08_12125 [Candidatus Methanoperedens sp.]|nr:hypothetical protein [Candidatus Methanoperedens sp.]